MLVIPQIITRLLGRARKPGQTLYFQRARAGLWRERRQVHISRDRSLSGNFW
jgi:hypothetical protein